MKTEFQKSKHQTPDTKEIPNTKHQKRGVAAGISPWDLRLGVFLMFGVWCLVYLLSAPAVHAQSYSIDWFTIDGGGGTSTGGVYTVSGTVGQPDAGPTMSGGNYSVDGGFWSLLSVVQTPGAPLLTITLTTTNTAMVSWPSPSTGFALQQNTNGLGTVNWSNVVTSPTDNGTIKYIIVNPPSGNRFYRLAQ